MKTEIIEALALELTKSKLSNEQPTASDLVQIYQESLKEIEEVISDSGQKKKATSRIIKGMTR